MTPFEKTNPEMIAYLSKVLLKLHHFESLSPKVVERLAAFATLRHFAAGRVIYLEGDAADQLYILEKGWV